MTQPLRIGILGAARITENGIVGPAAATGSTLLAIAARDPARATIFAAAHDIARIEPDYQALVEAVDIDIVYNALPNSMHAPWNLAAIAAGKHVLSEKPFAVNAAEARTVHEAAVGAGVIAADGFHYRYHPVVQRALEVLKRGELGELIAVEAVVSIPRPPAGDLRLSFELAGGALMDGGCYALHAVRLVGEAIGTPAQLTGITGHEFDDLPGIDERAEATFTYGSGAVGRARCYLNNDSVELTLTITGTRGWARVHNFVLPHLDDRLTVHSDGRERVEQLGTRSSYVFQLEAVLRAIRYGEALPTDSADAVRTMTLIDECYEGLGLPLRGTTAKSSGR